MKIEKPTYQRDSERASQMRAPLAPVETPPSQRTPTGAQLDDIDAEAMKPVLPLASQKKSRLIVVDVAKFAQRLRHHDAQFAG